MTYNEIFDEVKAATKRGDIDDKIRAAIREITLRCHRLDYFWRDFIEAQLSWAADGTVIDVNVLTMLPRFRAVKYVRYFDPTTAVLGNMLTKVDASAVLDNYNYEILDRFYMAGDILKLKFEYPTRGAQVGYYCSPLVHPYTSYSSWIANEFPDILIKGALANVLNQTGKQEEARILNQDVGFIADPGRNPSKGPTMVEQLRQFALEEDAR